MNPRPALAVLCVALAATNAQAQTTADGIAALARGDEARAAEILRPIAEDWRREDRDAAFFLGTMYETGRGVPLDPLRACALYQMAMGRSEGLYAELASRLVRHMLRLHGNEWYADCSVLANIGLGHRFETTSFTLQSGESVEWTLANAIVTYRGTARRVPVHHAGRGAIFLPLRRAELRVPGAASPNHFAQLLFWQPSGNTWSLHWFLYEIEKGNLRLAAAETALKTSEGREPTELSSSDLDALVHLGVDEQGLPIATLQTQTGPRIVPVSKR
jgi:hypothetical protein